MNLRRALSCGLLFLALLPVHGKQLRVFGKVSGLFDQQVMADVSIKIYRNGELLPVQTTGANGRYSVVLDNHSQYVLRFTKPGQISKCFTVDTNGAVWENDKVIQDLEIDIVLFETMPDLDLGWFDMPMGVGRFNPMTGHVAWNAEHERRVRPVFDRLMAEVAIRREILAQRRNSAVVQERN